MKMHIVMHELFEAPAAIEQWATNKGYDISFSRVFEGDTFPQDPDFDFLVVMGGPQSPATTKEECSHFDAQAEMDLIRKAVDADKLVLGVCLGAQLIGEALGGQFDHSPQREIGVFDVTLTQEGKDDPLFSSFPDVFPVGHWHGDMPGLIEGAEILAVSEGCPRQIVRYTPKVYGFQCHFEFTPDAIDYMIEKCGDEIAHPSQFIQDAEQLRKHNYDSINQLLFQFLDEFVKRE